MPTECTKRQLVPPKIVTKMCYPLLSPIFLSHSQTTGLEIKLQRMLETAVCVADEPGSAEPAGQELSAGSVCPPRTSPSLVGVWSAKAF